MDNFFTNISHTGERYIFNEEYVAPTMDTQEAARFLVEVIRKWRKKCSVFCNGDTRELNDSHQEIISESENEWVFSYQDKPYGCDECKTTQKILDRIFGDRRTFNALPFVMYNRPGDTPYYSFKFVLLKYYAKNGHLNTVRLMRKLKATRTKEVTTKRS